MLIIYINIYVYMYMNDYILIAIDAFLEAAEVEVKPTYRSPEQPAALKAFCQR